MTSTAEILKAARKLIEKPENWTQGRYARDRSGCEVDPEGPEGFCFCTIGAIRHVSTDYGAGLRARRYVEQLTEFGAVAFNDRATHSEVLELFSKAIAAAEASS